MKRKNSILILVFLLYVGVTTIQAQWISVKLNSNVKTSYRIDELSKLTYENENLSVNFITGEPIVYPIGDIAKIEYPTVDPDIPEIRLSVKVYLESMWDGSRMNKCKRINAYNLEDVFSGTIFDTLTIELHDIVDYSKIVYFANGLNVNQDGTINTPGKSYISVPSNLNGVYRITVKHRNHLETTSASAISFVSGLPSFDFTASASQTYGNNSAIVDGKNMLFSGDVVGATGSQDGAVDGLDAIAVDNKIATFESGYIKEDINGDGVSDGIDAIVVSNNIVKFVSVVKP